MAKRTLSPSTLHRVSLLLSHSLFPSFVLVQKHGRRRRRRRERERRTGEITRPPWAPRRARERCLLSQFANWRRGALPARILRLHFTIFRSEINAAPSAPAFLFRRCLATPSDPENAFDACEITPVEKDFEGDRYESIIEGLFHFFESKTV